MTAKCITPCDDQMQTRIELRMVAPIAQVQIYEEAKEAGWSLQKLVNEKKRLGLKREPPILKLRNAEDDSPTSETITVVADRSGSSPPRVKLLLVYKGACVDEIRTRRFPFIRETLRMCFVCTHPDTGEMVFVGSPALEGEDPNIYKGQEEIQSSPTFFNCFGRGSRVAEGSNSLCLVKQHKKM